jgi:hypothetical protein
MVLSSSRTRDVLYGLVNPPLNININGYVEGSNLKLNCNSNKNTISFLLIKLFNISEYYPHTPIEKLIKMYQPRIHNNPVQNAGKNYVTTKLIIS